MKIKRNVLLAPYTTFNIGGAAKFFCEVEGVEDLKEAVKLSKNNNIGLFVLGGGSNVLFSDKGFNGLVAKINIKGLEFKDVGSYIILSAGAGEDWDHVVGEAIRKNLGGIENLSLIPGTVGAAVYQNIGAYGSELKDVLENAEVYNVESGEVKTFSNADCQFGYRDSVFKRNGKSLVILKANLKLTKNPKPRINYPDLVKFFERQMPSISQVRDAVVKIRKSKLPYPQEVSNAGSFFKNPIVSEQRFKELTLNEPDLKCFNSKNGAVKLSAGQLIEKCGWKGKGQGNVGVSEKHSLVLVNYGQGTAEEIINLAEAIKTDIRNRFNVILEPEVDIIGLNVG